MLLSNKEYERNKGVVQMKEKCEHWVGKTLIAIITSILLM